MSAEKMRKEFEAWAAKHKHNLLRDGVVVDYACRYTDLAWPAWQASRAAIEVELPEPYGAFGCMGHGMGEADTVIDYDGTVEAIESLDLKVKP
ncbi:MAG TPA: hypothetical protein VN653_05525 [Anaerolineales bacterium]|nr:hypothetical protein [Anaerolineales bacterium]